MRYLSISRAEAVLSLFWAMIIPLIVPFSLRSHRISPVLFYPLTCLLILPIVLIVILLLAAPESRQIIPPLVRISRRTLAIVSASLCLGVWSIYGIIFYPGLISWDFYVQWFQASGKIPFSDWHPLLHTLLIWLVTRAWNSPAMVTLAQMAAMAILVGLTATRLYQAGVRWEVIFLAVLFYAFFPLNGFYAVSLWKDIGYAISLFWLSILMVDIALSNGVILTRCRCPLALLAATFCVSLIRHNGMLPAYGTLFTLLVAYPRRAKSLVPVLIALTAGILLFKGPVFNLLRVDVSEKNVLKAHLPIQHIGAVLQHDGYIPQANQDFLARVMPLDYWKQAYDPRSCMPLIFGKGQDGVPYLHGDFLKDNGNYRKFLEIWLTTVLHNPMPVLDYYLAGSELLWRIQVPYWQFVIADEDLVEEHLHSGYRPGPQLRDRVGPAGKFLLRLINEHGKAWFINRGSLYFWLGLFAVSIAVLLQKKRWVGIIAAPMLWQALSVAAFPLVQDTRFVYPMVLIAPLLIGLCFTGRKPEFDISSR